MVGLNWKVKYWYTKRFKVRKKTDTLYFYINLLMGSDALSLEANVSGKQWDSKLNQTAAEDI